MKLCEFTIPAALQLMLDDIGWFQGRDDRAMEQPSRTGMPRRHVLADYIATNEIGKAVNMKIATPFCIGEWDKYNILRRIPYSCKEGENWDSSGILDLSEAAEIRDYLNSAEYIELGYHGLLHDFWYAGRRVSGQEFFPPAGLVPPNGPNDPEDFVPAEGLTPQSPRELAPEWLIRCHLDAYREIYQSWGFTQELRYFVSPSGGRDSGKDDTFASILKDYGVRYWNNSGLPCTVRCGIYMNCCQSDLAPWEAYDLDPAFLPDIAPENAGFLGGHWVNLLRYHPQNALERVGAWSDYLNRQAETFGIILSRDVAFASHQLLYKNYSIVTEANGRICIDLTRADSLDPAGSRPPLYVSICKGVTPVSCEGGKLSVYETRKNFVTYRIDRTGTSIITI